MTSDTQQHRVAYVVAACLALVVLAGCGIGFGSRKKSADTKPNPTTPGATSTQRTGGGADAGAASPAARSYTVVLELSGGAKAANMRWNDGLTQTLTPGLPLPWSRTTERVGPGRPLEVTADNTRNESMTCVIKVDGRVVAQETDRGGAHCAARTPQA